MDWREIPSLSALRGFEAAARFGSLSEAARSLNITHAAIASHVRLLEDHFGCPLLERAGRGMRATPEGAALAESLSQAFGLIGSAVRDLAQDEDRPLRVTMTPSFAENWLMPIIGKFWSAYPEIQLELIPTPRVVDLRTDAIDLAIRYGMGEWPGTDPVPLADGGLVVVAAPDYIAGRESDRIADLADLTWLVDSSSNESRLWAEAQGLDLAKTRVLSFDTYTMPVQAARGGAGLAIVPEVIASRDLQEGRLVEVCRFERSGLAYHLVRRPGRVPKSLETVVKWLRGMASQPNRATDQ